MRSPGRLNIKKTALEKRIEAMKNLLLLEPVGYLDFLCLMSNAALVMTDSGGIQEETTFLGVPCLTLMENTERPTTVEKGTNMIVSCEKEKILHAAHKILNGKAKRGSIPKLWDGRTAERIVDILIKP